MRFPETLIGLGALVAVGAIAACGGGSSEAPAPEAEAEADSAAGTITIEVTNQRMEEVRLTVILDRQRRRIGTVRANSREEFQVPVNNVRQVRLEFDITLGPRCLTDYIDAGPGEFIPVRIPQNLSQMRAVCR